MVVTAWCRPTRSDPIRSDGELDDEEEPAISDDDLRRARWLVLVRSPWLRLGLLAVLVAAAVGLSLRGGGVSPAGLRESMEGLGMLGPLALVIVYALATLALLPGTPFTLASGLLFGPVLGSVTALVGATLGATLAFGLGRAVGREAVEQLAGRRVEALDRLLTERGLLAVLLVRLVPLFPFNLVNLVSGVTALRVLDYVLGTAVGIVPGVVLLAAMGGTIEDPTSPAFLAAAGGFVLLTVVAALAARRFGPSRTPAADAGPAAGQ